ncbi:hypothetical protein F5883DRAFT_246834 [Diaporthe sp. PMI_573]|nr:hypothetical protein F5883DRAFT_246834 [Diaporthaceae sp. PMI_573]
MARIVADRVVTAVPGCPHRRASDPLWLEGRSPSATCVCVCLSCFSLAGSPSRAAMAPVRAAVSYMLILDPHQLTGRERCRSFESRTRRPVKLPAGEARGMSPRNLLKGRVPDRRNPYIDCDSLQPQWTGILFLRLTESLTVLLRVWGQRGICSCSSSAPGAMLGNTWVLCSSKCQSGTREISQWQMDLVPATRPTAGKAHCSLQRSI